MMLTAITVGRMAPAPDHDEDEPTLAEIEFMFGKQNLPLAELATMLEREDDRLAKEQAALIAMLEKGEDVGEQLRQVRHEREANLAKLGHAQYQQDRLN